MEFCILAPTDKLEQYATLSRTHLVLAHENDLRYWDFYGKRRDAGDFIILDNGAYEGEMDTIRLRNMITTLRPNVAILPDYLGEQWQKTYVSARRFLDDYAKHFPNVQWMYVPQARPNDIVGWSIGLMNALEDERISWIGLPRCLAYLYTKDLYIRTRIAEHLKHDRPDIKLHALGMVKGSTEELAVLRELKCVESIDSHWPFKLGATSKVIPEKDEDRILYRLEECGVNTTQLR